MTDGAKTESEVSCTVIFDLVGMRRYAHTLYSTLLIAQPTDAGWNLRLVVAH